MTYALPDPDRHAAFYSGTAIKRGVAWIIDTVIVAAMAVVVLPLTAFTALFFWPLFYVCIDFLYRWATLSSRSATWGMRLMSVGFRDRTGRPFDAGTALVHTALYTLCISSVIPQLLSIGAMLTTKRGQSLPDLVIGSVCINRAA